MVQPDETDSIECHLQQIGMGTLICRAAKQTANNSTNEVSPIICFNCSAGKIFREVGCDAILPKIRIDKYVSGHEAIIGNLFCKLRKRNTSLEFCQSCNLVTAETTKKVISITQGIFKAQGYFSAYKDLEKARESIRDGNFENSITHSISCFESTMRICHEKLGKKLPKKKQITELWKSTRDILDFNSLDPSGATLVLLNSLTGTISHLGGLRNMLGDAHGKGVVPPDVSRVLCIFTQKYTLRNGTINPNPPRHAFSVSLSNNSGLMGAHF